MFTMDVKQQYNNNNTSGDDVRVAVLWPGSVALLTYMTTIKTYKILL